MPGQEWNDQIARPGLQDLLAGLGSAVPAAAPQHWSLGDIDRLIELVATKQGAEGPGANAPEAELPPAPLQSVQQDIPIPPPPEPPAVLEDATIPVPAPVSTHLTPDEIGPDEIGPAPAQIGMRFDLFQTREMARRVPLHQPVEKPGVILRRVDIQMTTDLSPVPTIVPAEEVLRQAQDVPALPEDIPEGQQRFPNFEAEEVRKLSDEEVRQQLLQSRAERTSQFRTLRGLADQMEEHGDTGGPAKAAAAPTAGQAEAEHLKDDSGGTLEYRAPGQRDQIFRALRQTRSRRATTAALLGLFAFGAAIFQALPLLLPDLDGNGFGFLFAQAMLLLAGLLAMGGDVLRGAKAIFRRTPNAESVLLVSGLLCAVQTVLLFFSPDEPSEQMAGSNSAFSMGVPCGALFLFTAAGLAAARWMQARHRCDAFRFVAYTHQEHLYALRLLEDPANNPNRLPEQAALPVPVRFPGNFMRESRRETAVDQSCSWVLPLGLGLAGLAGLSAGVAAGSVSAAFCAAAIALCLCVPVAGLMILMSLIRIYEKGQAETGIAILNTDAAEDAAGVRAFVLDSPDLFLAAKGRMHGWREYWQVRTDEVLLYAAAIAIAAGGPLQAVFNGVVEGDYSVLPDVLELSYEDRMGLTCWIHNQKVFFGNRKLLENHGVTVALTEKEERAYEHDGRKIIYLAVEKRLTAFFVVSYAADSVLKTPMRQLEKMDISARICNSDPCVTQDNLNAAFELEQNSLTVLRAAPSEAMCAHMRTPQTNESAGIYHTNNARAFLRALTAATALKAGIKRLRAFQLIGTLTAFLLLLIFALTKQMDAANNLIFIGFSLIWTAVAYTATRSN